MGNCARGASRHAVPWTDHDDGEWVWGAPVQKGSDEMRAGAEVTIRISKRRLQRLMVKAAGGGGMSVEKVLAEIVNASEVVDGRHRRRWEPALQSIPEALES